MMKIDLCKGQPDSECDTLDMELDETTVAMLERLAAITGETHEVLLERALLEFIATLQTDYVAEL